MLNNTYIQDLISRLVPLGNFDIHKLKQSVFEWYYPVIIEDLDRSDYKNSVIGLSYTFVKVTENKRSSLVDTNVNIVC